MFRSWKNWRAMRLTARGWFVLVGGIVVAPLFYVATQPAAVPADEPTLISHYETPCHYRERTARHIPAYTVDTTRGLIAWERGHYGTDVAAEFHAALAACDANEPVAKWNWGGMVLVSIEEIK